jgi:hypothetical protein
VRREASTHSSTRKRKGVSDCSSAGYKAAGGRGGDGVRDGGGGGAEGGYAEGSDDMAPMTLQLVVVEDAGGLRRGGMLGPECG